MLQASRVGCQRCPALCQSRRSIVDGNGPLDSLLMVVGDMPRQQDDRSGNPFVGQDGQLLRSTISEACQRLGVDSRRVYYTNAIRCRPHMQRTPEQDELDNCVSWLVEELETVNPLCVLAVGAIARGQVDECFVIGNLLRHGDGSATNSLQVMAGCEESQGLRSVALESQDGVSSSLGMGTGAWTDSRRSTSDAPLPQPVMLRAGSSPSGNAERKQFDVIYRDVTCASQVDRGSGTHHSYTTSQRREAVSTSSGVRSNTANDQSCQDAATHFSSCSVIYAAHPAFILKNRNKLANWTNQVEEAVRRAFGMQKDTVETASSDGWTFGTPDMTSKWLAADTEFDTLEEEYGSLPVGYSVSDGMISDFSTTGIKGPWPHLFLHNIKADADHLGIDLHDLDSWDDTMLQAYVTRRFKRVGLKLLAPELAGVDWGGVSIKDLLREYTPSGVLFKSGPRKGLEKPGKWHPVMFSRALEARPDECRKYAATDALATARIAMQLEPMLQANGGWAQRYYVEFEKPLVPVLLSMEQAGVRIDPDALNVAGGVIDAARTRTEGQLRVVFPEPLSLNGDEIKPILYDMGLVDGRHTDKGAIAVGVPDILRTFNADTIDDLPTDDPGMIARNLIEWRQMGKLRSTYVDSLLRKRDSADRVHGRYNQAVANTNRLSSSDPNLQNIPSRTEIGKALRRAFIPAPGNVFVGGDFSQLQLRVWAEYTRDPVFVDAYTCETPTAKSDFHQYAADQLGRPRSIVKNCVFAVLKGAEVDRAALTAGVSKEDAAAFIAQLHRDIPSLKTWKVRVSDTLAHQGYVESLMGWRMYYPDFWSTVRKWQSAAVREAADGCIQATEAGLVKAFMVEVYNWLRRDFPAWRMVLQVHDEVWCEGPVEQAEDVAARLPEVASTVAKRWINVVPIRFDAKVLTNWGGAKE